MCENNRNQSILGLSILALIEHIKTYKIQGTMPQTVSFGRFFELSNGEHLSVAAAKIIWNWMYQYKNRFCELNECGQLFQEFLIIIEFELNFYWIWIEFFVEFIFEFSGSEFCLNFTLNFGWIFLALNFRWIFFEFSLNFMWIMIWIMNFGLNFAVNCPLNFLWIFDLDSMCCNLNIIS